MSSQAAVTNRIDSLRKVLWSDTALLTYLAVIVLVGHLFTNGKYGYQRDEFYYLSCGRHLAWGYVDHPPLTPMIASLSVWLFGTSQSALRFFPAVAGALTVFVTGLICRELGGNRFAQVTAAIATMMAPLYIAVNGLLMPISVDVLAWTLSSYLVLRIIKYKDNRLWVLVGLIAGVGLLNKYNMAFYCIALVAGLLATGSRRVFLSGWFWAGSLVAILVILPNVLWQVNHGFATLEFLHNLNRNVMSKISRPMFLLWQVMIINPCAFPFWLAGLWFFLCMPEGKQYRVFGLIYVFILVFLLIAKGKPYYLGAAYPVLLAAGPIPVLNYFREKRLQWHTLRPAYFSFVSVGAVLAFPAVLPTLPAESSLRYEMSKIDKDYAEILGWEELAQQVSTIYHQRLTAKEQKVAALLADNYGEAGAIDLLGERYGLPKAISGHNNYYLWGPNGASGEITITVGIPDATVRQLFDDVRPAGVITNSQHIQNEEYNKPIFICRKPKRPLPEMWPLLKHFD